MAAPHPFCSDRNMRPIVVQNRDGGSLRVLVLDHIAVLAETLEEAAGHVESALGLPLVPGGKHEHFGTHNRLLGLGGGLYIEAIAIDPASPPPPYPRWFGLDGFYGGARLDKWICRVDDLQAALEKLPVAGRPVRLARGALEWTMAVPDDGMLPFDGLFPALIEWHSPVPPGVSMDTGGPSLERLVVLHPRAQELGEMLRPYLADHRVAFETSDTAGLRAEFPSTVGPRTLC